MKWLLAGLFVFGFSSAQNFDVIGPATTFQELLYSAPFPKPTYKVETKGCFEFLMKAMGMKNAPYEGDEITSGETTSRLVCYASDLRPSEVTSYVFDFTQALQTIGAGAYEMLFESTSKDGTSQHWTTTMSDRSFWIRYYVYPKGLLIFASVDQPSEGTE